MNTYEIERSEQSTILQRIGTEHEQSLVRQVMAQSLGIPLNQADDPETLGVLAQAAQLHVQYGAVPGVHMHAVGYETFDPKTKRARTRWSLIQGEKLWKDSALRHGRSYFIQHREMSQDELTEIIRSMGYTDPIDKDAAGIWARAMIRDEYEPMIHFFQIMGYSQEQIQAELEQSIPWHAGVWFGKIRAGNKWRGDFLPVGTTPAQVAQRRADKKALVASSLTLIPLDDRSEQQRIDDYTAKVRGQAETLYKDTAPVVRQHGAEEDEHGDLIFATERPRQRRRPRRQSTGAKSTPTAPRAQESAQVPEKSRGDEAPEDGQWSEIEELPFGDEPAPINTDHSADDPADWTDEERDAFCAHYAKMPQLASSKKFYATLRELQESSETYMQLSARTQLIASIEQLYPNFTGGYEALLSHITQESDPAPGHNLTVLLYWLSPDADTPEVAEGRAIAKERNWGESVAKGARQHIDAITNHLQQCPPFGGETEMTE